MLDKSVPYFRVFMRRPAGAPVPPVVLPDGYAFAFYQPGDEKAWARIETSVLEFDDVLDAYDYYRRAFIPLGDELSRRALFVQTAGGEKVGTATAYWGYSDGRRDPWIDWVSVRPDHQGRGLGKALVHRLLEAMVAMEGDRDFYLQTQTWSHRAIRIYEKAGFRLTDEPGLRGHDNDQYKEAVALLATL